MLVFVMCVCMVQVIVMCACTTMGNMKALITLITLINLTMGTMKANEQLRY
jgi:hypothetical protein